MPNPADVQKFLANSFGAGAIRKMAPAGTLDHIKFFLINIKLADAPKLSSRYPAYLNDRTVEFMSAMPDGAQHWGMARKCLNLFYRDALYNFYLRAEYGLDRFESVMEIPLDSIVGEALCGIDRSLPRWPGVIHLSESVSAKFQTLAAEIAANDGTQRVHLDLRYWPAKKITT